MNGAVNAAAAEQRLVGGIDNGIDLESGDVAFDDLDGVFHSRHRILGSNRARGMPAKLAEKVPSPSDREGVGVRRRRPRGAGNALP